MGPSEIYDQFYNLPQIPSQDRISRKGKVIRGHGEAREVDLDKEGLGDKVSWWQTTVMW